MSKMTTLENRFYDLYLEYFQTAEKTRRWNPFEDIPWAEAKKSREEIPDDIAEIAEAYFAVELYLPDYTSKILHLIRQSRGRHLFQCNWGYEESKHGLSIGMWMEHTGIHTRESLAAFEEQCLTNEYNIPSPDDPLYNLCYVVLQEYATRLNYTKFKEHAAKVNFEDAAFDKVFSLLARDEAAHYGHFKKSLQAYMEFYRDEVLETMNRVITNFEMPAQKAIPNWDKKDKLIVATNIFTPRIYMKEVVGPCLKALGIEKQELREARKRMAALEGEESAAA